MNQRDTLCVFAKPPRPGAVKTRLAAALGAEGAARLAGAFLADSWALAASRPWARPVLVTTEQDPTLVPGAELWLQGPGDLGARLERVLSRALDRSEAAIAIGTDAPSLPADRLDAAHQALASGADAVLGPAEDGGYYLIGLRRCPPGLLRDLPWSARDTLEATRRRLEARGLRVTLLEPWFDVDRPADLERLRALLRGDRAAAPATAALLAPRISIVMPVLDEARRIERALELLAGQGGLHEVIVVDGGSTDATVARARGAGARVLEAPRGRALQMNAGAAAAGGDVLLFLHADTVLPPDAASRVARALLPPDVVAGAFPTRTVHDGDGPAPWYAPLFRLADLRTAAGRLPYGDHALFVRTEVFRRLGGYPPVELMEDLELASRLRREGRIAWTDAPVQTSARRFAARPIYYFVLMNVFPLLYRAGVPPRTLARIYGEVR